MLKDTGLFKEMFGFEMDQALLDKLPLEKVKTMGEFIFLLIGSLDDPARYFKENMKGDTDTVKEMMALDKVAEMTDDQRLNRGVVKKMADLSPQILDSELIPDKLKPAVEDLKSGKYPKKVKELDISGNDLVDFGVPPEQRGVILNKMLASVYADTLPNKKKDLMEFLKQQ